MENPNIKSSFSWHLLEILTVTNQLGEYSQSVQDIEEKSIGAVEPSTLQSQMMLYEFQMDIISTNKCGKEN